MNAALVSNQRASAAFMHVGIVGIMRILLKAKRVTPVICTDPKRNYLNINRDGGVLISGGAPSHANHLKCPSENGFG